MSAEKIVEMLKENNQERGIELRIVLQLALVLKGCKQAGMLFIKSDELVYLREHLKKTSFKMAVLYSDTKKHLLYIYRKEELNSYLRGEKIQVFLQSYGYQGISIKDFLPRLRKRMGDYYKIRKSFPHEVGAFLGYPLCDIEGYVCNQGKNCLFSGYWKVYDDLEKTLHRFAEFDRAKREAVDEWYSGKRLYEIAS